MIRPQQCPVCKRPVQPADETTDALFPFSSERCRNVDLFRWWDGRYAVVEDLDPQVAERMQYDPDIEVQTDDRDSADRPSV